MATGDEGILGRFRGKIGPVVGVSNGGTFYMRSLPGKRKKAGLKELNNRAKFKAVLNHLEPIKDLVKAGFKGHYTKTGGYRAAFAYNRKYAVVGNETRFYIAPELFRFSGGDLPGAVNPAVSMSDDLLDITWDATAVTKGSLSDQMMVLLYDPISSVCITRVFDGPFRESGSYSITIPENIQGVEVEIYIGFIAADRSAQSDSQYLGRYAL